MSPPSLQSLPPRARIDAVSDPGSVAPVDPRLEAPRPSPHLARWGIAAQDDDGVTLARARVGGRPVLVAAQDERFLGGSVGAGHARALAALFECARRERPAAVVLLLASGGVRLHEANPAESALAQALTAALAARAAGIPVLTLGVGDVFGGASVLACAADRVALLPGTRLGLSGPKVIETAHGRAELDAGDADAIARVFGSAARAAAGQVDAVAADAEAIRGWIATALRDPVPFAARVLAMQARLGARLAAAVPAPPGVVPRPAGPAAPYFAAAMVVDPAGWLWAAKSPAATWLTRPAGAATLGPGAIHAQDAALLAQFAPDADDRPAGPRTLYLVEDSAGHEATRAAETLCLSQYLAQHAAVLALLSSRGVRMAGILAGTGHSAAFFVNALQAPVLYALRGARVIAMDPAAVARVTRLDPAALAALIDDDPLLGQPVRCFAQWGGVTLLPAFGGALPDPAGVS